MYAYSLCLLKTTVMVFSCTSQHSSMHETIQINILNIIYSYAMLFARNDKSTYKSYWDLIIMYKSNLYWSYRNYNITHVSILFIDQTYRQHERSLSKMFFYFWSNRSTFHRVLLYSVPSTQKLLSIPLSIWSVSFINY